MRRKMILGVVALYESLCFPPLEIALPRHEHAFLGKVHAANGLPDSSAWAASFMVLVGH